MSTEAYVYREKNDNRREIRRKNNYYIIKRRLHYWQGAAASNKKQQKAVLNYPCHCSKSCCAVPRHRKGKGISTLKRLYDYWDYWDKEKNQYI